MKIQRKWKVVKDGNGWGVEDAAGILENQEPFETNAAARNFALELQRAHDEWRGVQNYWSQTRFGE